jgi:hypothetical protein
MSVPQRQQYCSTVNIVQAHISVMKLDFEWSIVPLIAVGRASLIACVLDRPEPPRHCHPPHPPLHRALVYAAHGTQGAGVCVPVGCLYTGSNKFHCCCTSRHSRPNCPNNPTHLEGIQVSWYALHIDGLLPLFEPFVYHGTDTADVVRSRTDRKRVEMDFWAVLMANLFTESRPKGPRGLG